MPRPLIVIALAEEADVVNARFETLITGVGKVNATMALTAALERARGQNALPPYVLNVGSCGGHKVPLHQILPVASFLQADMDVRPLGFALGQTPFEDEPSPLLPSFELSQAAGAGRLAPALPCMTADRFVIQSPVDHPCLFDMEAYALAKVCRAYDLPFAALKYVTDNADGDAADHWQDNVASCKAGLTQLLKELDA